MKQTHRLIQIFIALAASAVGLSSCVVTDVGNPQEEKVDVELEFSGYAETRADALTLPSELRIDTAWIVLSQFRFQQAEACDEEGPFHVSEPVVVDLLASRPTYESPSFTTLVGDYCKLDVGFASVSEAELPQGAPVELAGRSVLVEGARADGVEFRIEASFDDLLHLNGVLQSFKIEEGQEHLIVGFALGEWINESRLDAVRDEDPIIIDEQTHPEMLADFKAAVGRSARLFRDRNGNRRLDIDERGNAVASGAQNSENGRGDEAQEQQQEQAGRAGGGQGQPGD